MRRMYYQTSCDFVPAVAQGGLQYGQHFCPLCIASACLGNRADLFRDICAVYDVTLTTSGAGLAVHAIALRRSAATTEGLFVQRFHLCIIFAAQRNPVDLLSAQARERFVDTPEMGGHLEWSQLCLQE